MLYASSESLNLWTRRQWLKTVGASTVGAACAPALRAVDGPGPVPAPLMQIAILRGTISRPTLAARLDAVKAFGLDCVQLNLGCAGLSMMPDEIPREVIAKIRREAESRKITIASLEGTFNMSHPDPKHRRT
ncbi:MAG: hypothetical protein JXB62_12280 [Pirellulales bacterium]|nr:hypothetical protein [Pirellulales bacterium]